MAPLLAPSTNADASSMAQQPRADSAPPPPPPPAGVGSTAIAAATGGSSNSSIRHSGIGLLRSLRSPSRNTTSGLASGSSIRHSPRVLHAAAEEPHAPGPTAGPEPAVAPHQQHPAAAEGEAAPILPHTLHPSSSAPGISMGSSSAASGSALHLLHHPASALHLRHTHQRHHAHAGSSSSPAPPDATAAGHHGTTTAGGSSYLTVHDPDDNGDAAAGATAAGDKSKGLMGVPSSGQPLAAAGVPPGGTGAAADGSGHVDQDHHQHHHTLAGQMRRMVAFVLLLVVAYAALYLSVGSTFWYGGPAWSTLVIWVAAQIGGWLCGLVQLPPLLGMLLVGLLLRNACPSLISGLPRSWSTTFRTLALGAIFLRSGLELDLKVFRRVGPAAVRLLLIPGLTEAAVTGGLSMGLLGFPWAFAFTMGFILKAVGPAVVIQTMFELQKQRLGVAKGIPSIVVGAASFDDMVALTGYGLFSNLAMHTGGSMVWPIIKGPLEILLGIVGGCVGAAFCSLTVLWDTRGKRTAACVFAAAALLFLFYHFEMKTAGPLSALVTGMLTSIAWDKGLPRVRWLAAGPSVEYARQAERDVGRFWRLVAQPLLFGIIGTLVNLRTVQTAVIPRSIGIIIMGLVVRIPMSYLAMFGAGLTRRERFFVALAWTPKATVQAALGAQPLDTIRANEGPHGEHIAIGEAILTTSVLAILICSTFGVMLIHYLAPKWLVRGGEMPGLHKRRPEQQQAAATAACPSANGPHGGGDGGGGGGAAAATVAVGEGSRGDRALDTWSEASSSAKTGESYSSWRSAFGHTFSATAASMSHRLGSIGAPACFRGSPSDVIFEAASDAAGDAAGYAGGAAGAAEEEEEEEAERAAVADGAARQQVKQRQQPAPVAPAAGVSGGDSPVSGARRSGSGGTRSSPLRPAARAGSGIGTGSGREASTGDDSCIRTSPFGSTAASAAPNPWMLAPATSYAADAAATAAACPQPVPLQLAPLPLSQLPVSGGTRLAGSSLPLKLPGPLVTHAGIPPALPASPSAVAAAEAAAEAAAKSQQQRRPLAGAYPEQGLMRPEGALTAPSPATATAAAAPRAVDPAGGGAWAAAELDAAVADLQWCAAAVPAAAPAAADAAAAASGSAATAVPTLRPQQQAVAAVLQQQAQRLANVAAAMRHGGAAHARTRANDLGLGLDKIGSEADSARMFFDSIENDNQAVAGDTAGDAAGSGGLAASGGGRAAKAPRSPAAASLLTRPAATTSGSAGGGASGRGGSSEQELSKRPPQQRLPV